MVLRYQEFLIVEADEFLRPHIRMACLQPKGGHLLTCQTLLSSVQVQLLDSADSARIFLKGEWEGQSCIPSPGLGVAAFP